MKYLDPKADLTFKKIFGNHPKRLISLLNALLPLSDEEQIRKIKYLPTELVPQLEGGKNTIVDVLCTDVRGRKFCVGMQMEWSDAFQQRVLFNASKLYVSQAKKGGKYSELQPVYSLNLVNDIFVHDTPDFIHNYRIVHDKDSNKVIEGLHFTFIELPKFTPHSIADKRMMVLWLRFLTEINSNTKDIPSDLLNDPEIGKAVEELEISGFTDAELRAYDKFWDSVQKLQLCILGSLFAASLQAQSTDYTKGLSIWFDTPNNLDGRHLSPSTVSNWMMAAAQRLEPIYNELRELVKDSYYVMADETPHPVLESDRPGALHRGYMWN